MGAKFDSMIETGATFTASVSVTVKGKKEQVQVGPLFFGYKGVWTTKEVELPHLSLGTSPPVPTKRRVPAYTLGHISCPLLGYGQQSSGGWSTLLG